ncbi:hypothetical protein Y032_0902g2961 [Ancylostoma ceylanicum]|nr:hypothetical protein Y032_0902g2961 [Ancylostoma ceylanicum]
MGDMSEHEEWLEECSGRRVGRSPAGGAAGPSIQGQLVQDGFSAIFMNPATGNFLVYENLVLERVSRTTYIHFSLENLSSDSQNICFYLDNLFSLKWRGR